LTYANEKGMIDQVPTVEALGRYGTAAVASWAISKWGSKNPMWRHFTTGLGSVAIHNLVKANLQGVSVAEVEGGAPILEEEAAP
jgi:hypothetical protein